MEPEDWPDYRFYVDPETDDYHFAGHNVGPEEVVDVLEQPELRLRGRDETYRAIGQTAMAVGSP